MNQSARFTEAARYADMLKQCVPAENWQEVCAEIQAIADIIVSNKEYARWALRDAHRWDHIINLSEHPELTRLLQLLKKTKRITFIVDIANELADKKNCVVVEHAGPKPTSDKQIKDLIHSVWGQPPALIYEQNDDLIEGIKLTCGNQTFDTSFKRYRHDLIAKMRNA